MPSAATVRRYGVAEIVARSRNALGLEISWILRIMCRSMALEAAVRVAALQNHDGTTMIYSFGDYRIDTVRFEIARRGQVLAVEPQVLDLLIVLIEGRDKVISRDELFARIWKGRIVSDATLSSRIKTARQVIGDNGGRQDLIKTIHGRGFRFVGNVVVGPEPETVPQERRPAFRRTEPAIERPATRYAKSGETHIAYQLFGEGSFNLVLTPGFVSHIDNYWEDPHFARWLRRLSGKARVAMFDKRGTGMSDRVSALPAMDERMDDVRAVMDAVGFDSAFIMGISEGGTLAVLFSACHPGRCNGLILYGSFAQFKHWYPDHESLQQLYDYIETDWGTGKSLQQFAPSMCSDPEFCKWWGKFERLGATPGAATVLMKMNSQIDIFGILPSVRVPTLVIHRKEDVLIDLAAGRDLSRHIPGAQYVELPGKDHLPWVGDNSDEIVDAIGSFLDHPMKAQASSRVLATILSMRLDAGVAKTLIENSASDVWTELRRFRPTRTQSVSPGVVALFDGPARALECAVSVSHILNQRGLVHRIGIHAGEIDIEDEIPHGTAMEIAADVAGHAGNNEIFISRTVNDLVAGSGIALCDRGEFLLQALGQEWRLFQAERPSARHNQRAGGSGLDPGQKRTTRASTSK
jgi:DNA-binding winged helix-turn-helix (wHTH) protein